MAKASPNKNPKTLSGASNNLKGAPVKKNAKPVQRDITRLYQQLQDIQDKIVKAVPDWADYSNMRVIVPNKLLYSIRQDCPLGKYAEIEWIITELAAKFKLSLINAAE